MRTYSHRVYGTLIERLLPKVTFEPNTGCWLWLAACDQDGYAILGKTYAHIVSYEIEFGPVPEGLQLDHLCRQRCCVNPRHLEPVTISENVRRGKRAIKMCPKGHPYSEENTYITPLGHRQCRICKRIAFLAFKEREKLSV